jgi:hypothetical protein
VAAAAAAAAQILSQRGLPSSGGCTWWWLWLCAPARLDTKSAHYTNTQDKMNIAVHSAASTMLSRCGMHTAVCSARSVVSWRIAGAVA